MCGINGFSFQDSGLIGKMTQASLHRGADYIGVYESPELTLAHNLLAIRGPAGACHQPLFQVDSDWVLAFVGEIYNTDDIKRRFLPALQTEIDTHILYDLIALKGWDFALYIQGMYAIALFNKKERKLRLYRDPSGQKGLYYYWDGREFLFSSEIRPLTLKPGGDLSLDVESIQTGSLLGYVPFERTIFRKIHKVRMGEVVSLDLARREVSRIVRAVEPTEILSREPGEPAQVLSRQIRQHFASQVPVALNLSGGMDSSVLFQELVEAGVRFEAFTTRFEVEGGAPDYNEEFDLAARLCKQYGVPHRDVTVTKSAYLECLPKAYSIIEEPNYNIGNPIYLLTAMAEGLNGSGYRVVLSGDGGDEVFSGYAHHRRAFQLNRVRSLLGTPAFNYLMSRKHGLERFDFSDPTNLWLYLRSFQKTGADFTDIRKSVRELLPLFAAADTVVKEMLHLDRILWVSSENCIRSDKLFMSQSIELRAPFCYHPLRLYFDRVLGSKDYLNREFSKQALRRLYEGRLPDFITKRSRKWGWRPPLELWYAKDVADRFVDILDSSTDGSSEIVDWAKLRTSLVSSVKPPSNQALYYLSLAAVARSYGVRV